MDIDDITDGPGNQFPARITVPLTSECEQAVMKVCRMKKKRRATVIREIVEAFVKANKQEIDGFKAS